MFEYTRIWEGLLAIALCLVLLLPGFLPWLSEAGLDLLFHTRPVRATSQSIVIIGVDEESLAEYGPWPFSRKIHADLLGKLKGAKSIGFDIIFSDQGSEDHILANALHDSPPGVLAVASSYQGIVLKPTKPLSGRAQLGHIETELGIDGIIRRVPLYKYEFPVLAAAMAEIAGFDISKSALSTKKSQLINFYGPEFTYMYLSYRDVLEGEYASNIFHDRYVLIGSKALAMGDFHITPYSHKHPIPGVEVQATILNNILDDSFLKEPQWLVWLLSLACLAMLLWVWPQKSETRNAFLSFGFALCIFLLAFVLFRFNFYLNFVVPLFILILCYLVHSIFLWVRITFDMISEIRALDYQLEDGVEKVFMTLPSSLVFSPKKRKPLKLTGGIQKHIHRMHRGIQALALQNGFINHLLSEETPPLILWQKQSGYIVLANNRFSSLWNTILQPSQQLPDLEDFTAFLKNMAIQDLQIQEAKSHASELEFGTVDRTLDILTVFQGKKSYHRVVIHSVNDTEVGFTGVLASFTDVTEIRELERIKSEVMNIVSHELKLPLTTIIGFAEMLSESLHGQEKVFADQIQSQSTRLAKMIEDFLDIARIESGKYLIHRYPFDLLSITHDAASGVSQAAAKKEIVIGYDLPQKISPLLGDESLLTQVILNLLDNAVKFSPQGTEVKLSITEKEQNILITVEDGGEGVADDEKPKVFEKFIRGAGQVKGSGFGLGLSFVKEVVEGHSGKIAVGDSSLGGAKFTMTLPKSDQK